MSTLSGQASKGEKTKSKFQSLDINNLYRVSRGESTEKQQQKSSSIYIKHGMQSLGKVPSARRAPANLPSLKSEHSETGAAVPLVPPGGPGWGKQDPTTPASSAATTNSTPTQSTTATSQAPNQGPVATQNPPQLSSHQAAIAIPVTTTIPPHNKPPSLSSAATPATGDKLWSSVTSGGADSLHPPPYQSPQFQHEFPSLSAGDGGPIRTGSDAPYPSGLSLRPQTEGSWTQGGARPGASDVPQRSGSGPLGAPPQLSVQAGLAPQQPLPPQFRNVMPSFMYKGNFPQTGPATGLPNQNTAPPPSVNGRNRPDNRPPRLADNVDEVTPRPIIKEEELSRMDEIGSDMGWAISDEIDYNQKLAFSDDESDTRSNKKEKRDSRDRDIRDKQQHMNRERDLERSDSHSSDGNRNWSSARSATSRGRSSEEEDIRMQRRTQQEVEIAVQRAKQRKEEEEKRFNEATKQGAAKKLMELEEKINKRGECGSSGTINPSSVPPKPINQVDIPLPDFQKDKDNRSRTPNENIDGKLPNANRGGDSFRHLTQIEGKNFPRKHTKPTSENRERDRDSREQNGPFYKYDVPPRFRTNTGQNLHQQQQQQQQSHYNQWMGGNNQNSAKTSPNVGRNIRDSPERDDDDRRDYKRQSSEDSYRSSHHSQADVSLKSQDNRYNDEIHHGYDYNNRRADRDRSEDDKWQKERSDKKQDYSSDSRDDWHDRREKNREEKSQDKYERPQRPDSRDSRSAKESRHSREVKECESRDYMGSWSESAYEPPYEDRRRDHVRDDRRVVPGPITKDRIEADDMRNEKRHLTQLKRGQNVDKKASDSKRDEKMNDIDIKKGKESAESQAISTAWADCIPGSEEPIDSKFVDDVKPNKQSQESHKSDSKHFGQDGKKSDKNDVDYKDNRSGQRSGNRERGHSQRDAKGWGTGSSDYHRSAWNNKSRPTNRGHKSGGGSQRPSSAISGEFHCTDSEGSVDDHHHSEKGKKNEKDEKNRDAKQEKGGKSEKRSGDNYMPRGEPSRHGRGGGNFNRNNSRLGGMSKRIDGYGPPPKSPFGHHDDKDKKASSDEASGDPVVEDKTKLNQQALAAGIIGSSRKDGSGQHDEKKSRKTDNRRGKSRSKGDGGKNKEDDMYDTNSELSDEKDGKSGNKKAQSGKVAPRGSSNSSRRNNQPPRMGGEKRYNDNTFPRQNSSGSLSQSKKDDKATDQQSMLLNAMSDMSLKNRDPEVGDEKEDKSSINGDSEGFQEVKSKKTVKERQKPPPEEKNKGPKNDKEKIERKKPVLTHQQIQNIPSLMATPVNPPQVLPKNPFERPRQTKLAPRFAKQKMQKAQMQQQQQHNMCDVNDMNKVNQNINVYNMKDPGSGVSGVSAWDKPLGSQLRSIDHEMLGVPMESCKGLQDGSQVTPQGPSPNNDKGLLGKNQEKPLLDGTTPPVNTIIFENTNFKSAPGSRNARNDKPRKLEENSIDSSVIANFNKPLTELIGKDKSDSIQLPLSFKEDNGDMKLDFFDSDLSDLTDKGPKNLIKSMHAITSSGNSTICTADSLNIKIASVKKVWETPSEHAVGQDDSNSSFSNSFDTNALDPNNVFTKANDSSDDHNEGYSQSPNQPVSSTTNVCKVKPTQQVTGAGGPTVLSSTTHQPHSGIATQSLMGNPLSPPPMQHVPGAGVGLGQPPQAYNASQHIGYQTGLGGSSQYGVSAIPSPPTAAVLYNSTQALPAANAASLYGTFQVEQAGVLGGQNRSQYSQYPYGLGQTASSPYSNQSVFLQTAPHPPPQAAQPLQDLYQNYRLNTSAPFAQNQQLNNQSTVLISTSNTMMSASVKPSTQQISAIGTKAGGVGQAYQQQSQQQGQMFVAYDPTTANYLSNVPRGPGGPVQNNVVPALQPSTSYYSGSTGAQTGFFQQPGNTTQLPQHQANYGLQGNVFGSHNQTHTNTGYNYLSAPMQIAAAAALTQFRNAGLQAASYLNQQMGDKSGRSQQLKSPGTQEALSSVFSGSQIPSPKSRQNSKHPPPQSSPTAQHKYNLYQNMNNQQTNVQRYPTPIQRPVNFQQNLGSVQNNVNQKHRSSNVGNKAPARQYYGSQNNSISSQNEKVEDSKLTDNGSLSNSTSTSNSSNISNKNSSTAVNSTPEIKEVIKEEAPTLKD